MHKSYLTIDKKGPSRYVTSFPSITCLVSSLNRYNAVTFLLEKALCFEYWNYLHSWPVKKTLQCPKTLLNRSNLSNSNLKELESTRGSTINANSFCQIILAQQILKF